MAKYKLSTNGVIREDGACIPDAAGNRDWNEYQEWLAAGNTPDPQYTLNELREQKVSELKEAYNQTLNSPLAVTAGSKSFNIDITEKAQIDWMKLLITGGDVEIRTADNATVALSAAEFAEIVGQISTFCKTNWTNRCTKIDLARNTTTTNTLTKLNAIHF